MYGCIRIKVSYLWRMQIHSHHHCHSSRVNPTSIPLLRLHYSHLKETSFALWCSSRKWQQRINHSRNIGALAVIKFIYLHPIKFVNRVTNLKENKTLSLHVFIQPTSTCFYISLFTVWLYVHVFKKLDTYLSYNIYFNWVHPISTREVSIFFAARLSW